MPISVIRRVMVAAVVAGGLVAGVPATASAAAAFTPCADQPHFECATVTVPLDRSGAVPGTVPLHVERERGTGDRTTAWIALAGGPGQAADPLAEGTWRFLAGPVDDVDQVVTFDQRGTGQSGLLDCTSAFQKATSLQSGIARCGAVLGARRPFYSTTATVADIEDIRQAVGADKVVLVGVSYGTYVAFRYARAHPDRVAGMVLDSVVPPSGEDQWYRSTYAAVPRILRTLCAKRACPFTRDTVGDVKVVAGRMSSRVRRAAFYSSSGRRKTVRLGPSAQLFDLLLSSDFSPQTRAFIPGAIAAARKGDWAPLVRLVSLAASAGLEGIARTPRAAANPQADESDALNLAASCADSRLPWDQRSDPAVRLDAFNAAGRRLAPSAFTPFTTDTAKITSLALTCFSWPATDVSPVPDSGAPLAVPTLLLSGGADLRTPTEDAARTRALLPGAQLVTVAGVGHYTLGNDPTGCIAEAYRRFLVGTAVGDPCAGRTGADATQPQPPLHLGDLKPFGARGTVGRLVRTASLTANDAVTSAHLLTPDAGGRLKLGGLRGGRISVADGATSTTYTLTRVEYLPGVRISGTLRTSVSGSTAALRIDGGSPARRGTVKITGRSLSGRVGGKRISVSASRAAQAAGAPSATPGWRGPGVDIG